MLLALDTATAYVTTCVYDDEMGVLLAQRSGIGPQRHGEMLTPAVAEVLAEAGVDRRDLTGLVVGVGPGPYTGLRVGLVTARVLGLTLGVPVRGVVTLDALALAAGLDEPFVATLDARRKELFWASYDAQARRVDGPAVGRPADLSIDGRPVVGAGPGLYPERFDRGAGPRDPQAVDLARLATERPADTVDPEPVYLRRPDAVALAARG